MRRRPILSIEEVDDGLEVTRAIQALEISRTSSPQQVAVVAERTVQLEENEDKVDQSENPEVVDQAEQAGVDVQKDNSTDPLGAEDDFDIDATKDELEGNLNDSTALECIACDLESGKITELSDEQKALVQGMAKKYDCDCNDGVAIEGISNITLADVRRVLGTILNTIVQTIQKLIEAIREAINIYRSRLRVAAEDLVNIRKNTEKMVGKIASTNTITAGHYSLIMSKDTRTAKDVINNINSVDQLLKGYFDHVRNNMRPYIDSVANLFDNTIKEARNLVNDENEHGQKAINTRGSIRLNKDTVPGYLRPTAQIKGHLRPVEGLTPLRSPTMPGGVLLGAWVSGDDDVTTAGKTAVLSSKIFLSTDLDYERPDPELPVMTASELNTFLASLDKVISTMSNGEPHMLYYYTQLASLQKIAGRLQADAKTMESMDVINTAPHLIAYKRRAANLMMSLVLLTDNFYGKPNRSMMFYGNRLLAASIKYANAITAEYLTKPQTK